MWKTWLIKNIKLFSNNLFLILLLIYSYAFIYFDNFLRFQWTSLMNLTICFLIFDYLMLNLFGSYVRYVLQLFRILMCFKKIPLEKNLILSKRTISVVDSHYLHVRWSLKIQTTHTYMCFINLKFWIQKSFYYFIQHCTVFQIICHYLKLLMV